MESQFKITVTRLCIVLFLVGCAGSYKKEEASTADKVASESNANSENGTIPENVISSSAAKETGKDSTRKFIRTADIKFKVKNVVKATYAIEDITNKFNGFVTYTNLLSTVDYKTSVPISADSILETTYFTVQNSMTIRVPNTLLDTTLKEIAKHIDFLDHRIIKTDNVGLQILANKLMQRRVNKHEQRLTNAIDKRGKKLNETNAAEENLLTKQEQSDNALISNLSLNDQISYSTITLNIYQRQSFHRELILNEKNIQAYEPGFLSKIKDAFISGWNGFQALILLLVNTWVLIVFIISIFFIYRKFFKKSI